MKNSRAKGVSAEREVARLIEAWWSQAEPGCRFVRTPQSGGWHGSEVRAAFRASGDLMTTAQRFPFCIEVKRRESWSERELRAGRASPVWAWWQQTCDAANELHAAPMMWFRASRRPWWVMTSLLHPAFPEHSPARRLGHVMPWDSYEWPAACPSSTSWPVVFEASDLLALDPRSTALPRRRGVAGPILSWPETLSSMGDF